MEAVPADPVIATILIPTVNNSTQLKVVLQRLQEDADGSYTILVIDSSKDTLTKDLCEQMGVTHLADDSRTRADACNHGIANVTTPFTLFTDDDVVPPHGWVSKLVRWFGDETVSYTHLTLPTKA